MGLGFRGKGKYGREGEVKRFVLLKFTHFTQRKMFVREREGERWKDGEGKTERERGGRERTGKTLRVNP